jgi:processive 1,2-diacylglycerol beta-glucosyltransferase
MPRRILIMSAAVGGGHLRAAEAVELAVRELDPSAQVRNVDILTLTNAAFRRVYGKLYLDIVNRAPHVLGYFYDLLDRPTSTRRFSDRLRILVEKLNLGKFLQLLHEEPWDIVISTQFLAAEIISGLRKKQKLHIPQFTVTTDFETHRMWVNQPCDHYFTATEEGAVHLQNWDVPAKDVSVTGIPIHPVFSRPKERSACLHRQGLRGDRPIVLQLAGGFGVGPMEKLFREVLQIDRPLEIVVVCGRNEKLLAKLAAIAPPPRHHVKVFGFTKEIDELMQVADVVLTKPGGLTSSEVLARGAAMAIVNPIPGQESRNSDFLLENGAAIKVNNLTTLRFKLSQLLDNPARLQQLKANARRLAKPLAAFDVAKMALTWPRREG